MNKMAAFGDLKVQYTDQTRVLEDKLSTLLKLGFKTIALNIDCTLLVKTKLPNSPNILKLQEKFPNLKIYTRLTAVIDNSNLSRHLASDLAQKFDLIAVRPTTEKIFQHVCGHVDCDIISLDFTSRLPFYMKLPQIRQAAERGIHFEIIYSPALCDSSARKYIFSNALELVRFSRGRSTVISSEANSMMDIRGPYDIANLGLLFGLKQDQAKAAISKNIRAVLFHAEARKNTVGSAISFCKTSDLSASESWKIPANVETESSESEEDSRVPLKKKQCLR